MGRIAWRPITFFAILTCATAMGQVTSPIRANPTEEPTIAVVDLVDKGPSVELAVLRTAFAEMLCGDLSQYQDLLVVERVRVDQFLREANLQKGFTDAAAAHRAGQALAAEYLLTGSFSGKDKTVTLDVSLFQVASRSRSCGGSSRAWSRSWSIWNKSLLARCFPHLRSTSHSVAHRLNPSPAR